MGPARWWRSERRRRLVGAGRSSLTGHHFRCGLTLRTRHIEGNSPRRSSSDWGDRSRVRDDGRLARTFGDVDDELQWLANDEIRLRGGGTTRRRAAWCWLGLARSPTEQWRAGQWLGFQYLRIKIHHRTTTIYRAFVPNRRRQRS
jgi:hypothetical protein